MRLTAQSDSPRDISASGNRYLQVCAVTERATEQWTVLEFEDASMCQGYTMGLREGVKFATLILSEDIKSLKGSSEDLGLCVPDGVTLGQEISIALKYIREHPETAHMRSSVLSNTALLHAFPCLGSTAKTKAP